VIQLFSAWRPQLIFDEQFRDELPPQYCLDRLLNRVIEQHLDRNLQTLTILELF